MTWWLHVSIGWLYNNWHTTLAVQPKKRDMSRMDYYGRRNDVLFTTLNVPMPWLPAHLAMTLLNGVRWAFRARRFRFMFRGMMSGLLDAVRLRKLRAPVPAGIYRLQRLLKKEGPLRLAEIEPLLPLLLQTAPAPAIHS